jgi:hypothetical protein
MPRYLNGDREIAPSSKCASKANKRHRRGQGWPQPLVGLAAKQLAQDVHDGFGICNETAVAELQGVTARKRLQIIGQFAFGWHRRAIDEDRDYWDVSSQRGRDLNPYEVVLVVQPAPAVSIGRVEPPGADNREQNLTLRQFGFDLPDEIRAGPHRIHVKEDSVARKMALEMIAEATRNAKGVLASITDEYARHGIGSDPQRCVARQIEGGL